MMFVCNPRTPSDPLEPASQPPFLPSPVPFGKIDCDFVGNKIIGYGEDLDIP